MKRYALILLAVAMMVFSSLFSQSDQCQFGGGCTALETFDRWLEYAAIAIFVVGLVVYLLGYKKKEK